MDVKRNHSSEYLNKKWWIRNYSKRIFFRRQEETDLKLPFLINGGWLSWHRFKVVKSIPGITFLPSEYPHENTHVSFPFTCKLKTCFNAELGWVFCFFRGTDKHFQEDLLPFLHKMKVHSATFKVALQWNITFWLALLKPPSVFWLSITCNNKFHHSKATGSKGPNHRTSLALSECWIWLSELALAMLKLKLQLGWWITFFFFKTRFYSLNYFWWSQP